MPIYYRYDPVSRRYVGQVIVDAKPAFATLTPPASDDMVYDTVHKMWVAAPNQEPPFYAIKENKLQQYKQVRAAAMLAGEAYNGYQVSFAADDGNALLQVKAAFEMGLTATVIHFENGTNMPLASIDFATFSTWFLSKRGAFFSGTWQAKYDAIMAATTKEALDAIVI